MQEHGAAFQRSYCPISKNTTAKHVVIKYGGNAMINDELKQAVMSDLVAADPGGHPGGAGPRRRPGDQRDAGTAWARSPSLWTACATPMRRPWASYSMVLAGQVNKGLVALLKAPAGRRPVRHGRPHHHRCSTQVRCGPGLCGRDRTRWTPRLIEHLLADSFIPVIATVGMDDNGIPYNINADTAAARDRHRPACRKTRQHDRHSSVCSMTRTMNPP